LLAINRLCAPGSELTIEQRWYPSTALDSRSRAHQPRRPRSQNNHIELARWGIHDYIVAALDRV
jgi:hypothetical protein